MTNKDNGGPAFPCDYEGSTRSDASGLSIRDYMAIHASEEDVQRIMAFERSISRNAARYMHADLMLKERAK